MTERYFRAVFRRRDGWNGNHVQGNGFKSVNGHWFDEGTSREVDWESEKKKATRIIFFCRCHIKKNQRCQRTKFLQFILC
ncbi:unnamed protein product [Pocillopora meandrina]|uniref:Uncharacterized protein n=1 Tax=Pocillopora meandrina TaxID=46732 RepID=A0AAU9VKP1_9CNID|nr:unnamed protein product [Pocillopora meandrina]